jgi:transposase
MIVKTAVVNPAPNPNEDIAKLKDSKVNMAYRWFLGIFIKDNVPNFSTFSQNYHRHYSDTAVYEKIFTAIVTNLCEKVLINTWVIFDDGHILKAMLINIS